MGWDDIVDGEVDAYSPHRWRMWRHLRNRDEQGRFQVLRATDSVYTTAGDPTPFATIGTVRLWTGDCFIGNSGMRLRLQANLSSAFSGAGSATYRLKAGASTSNVKAFTAIGAGTESETNIEFILDATPTANTVTDIEVQLQVSGDHTSSTWTWTNRSDAYIAALPR